MHGLAETPFPILPGEICESGYHSEEGWHISLPVMIIWSKENSQWLITSQANTTWQFPWTTDAGNRYTRRNVYMIEPHLKLQYGAAHNGHCCRKCRK
jgi:hypothetical protein